MGLTANFPKYQANPPCAVQGKPSSSKVGITDQFCPPSSDLKIPYKSIPLVEQLSEPPARLYEAKMVLELIPDIARPILPNSPKGKPPSNTSQVEPPFTVFQILASGPAILDSLLFLIRFHPAAYTMSSLLGSTNISMTPVESLIINICSHVVPASKLLYTPLSGFRSNGMPIADA